jgi:ParB/RepB/Spo0J family partition protein
MAGVSLNPPPTTARPSPPAPSSSSSAPAAAVGVAPASKEIKHPIGSGIAFERVEDVYRMDPRKIVLEGPYVRQFIADAEFERLRSAVAIDRDIGQAIGIRIVGPPTDQRRVLIYGMRRWRAALAEELDKVPVRDYGRISEEKAIELQLLENEVRADPHPIDTALGFYLLSRQPEWPQKRIAHVFDKNKGYVSEMVRVGEALSLLDEETRRPMYKSPAVTVRAFQSVAQVKDVEARRDALLGLINAPDTSVESEQPPNASAPNDTSPNADVAGAMTPADAVERTARRERPEHDQAARRRVVDEAVFHIRTLRNGRSFRVRWTDDDLRRDGITIAEEFRRRMLEEYTHLLHRATVLAANSGGQGTGQTVDIEAVVAEAARDAARVDVRLASLRRPLGSEQGQGRGPGT